MVYLITTVTQGRSAVFANFELARLVIAELRACDERGTCQTLAFVLMPDHLHWLVQLRGGELSALVGYFKAHAAKVVNRRRGMTGESLWQHGFYDQALRREEDLVAMARYVVRNPVRAGLVKKAGDYPHWDAIWLS
jgi:REP element-mobilizing transposase RayT